MPAAILKFGVSPKCREDSCAHRITCGQTTLTLDMTALGPSGGPCHCTGASAVPLTNVAGQCVWTGTTGDVTGTDLCGYRYNLTLTLEESDAGYYWVLIVTSTSTNHDNASEPCQGATYESTPELTPTLPANLVGPGGDDNCCVWPGGVTLNGTVPSFTVPGCTPCCSTDCEILVDAFFRADGSPGGSWNQALGTWSISSYRVSPASSPAALIATKSVPADDLVGIGLRASMQGANGDKPQLILGWTDSNNYLAGQWDIAGNQIALISVAGGTPTTLATAGAGGFSQGETVGAAGCYTPGGHATFGIGPASVTAKIPGLGPWPNFGIGSGAGTPSCGDFSSWENGQPENNCPPCRGAPVVCDLCTEADAPEELLLTWPDMLFQSFLGCPDVCPDLAGIWVLSFAGQTVYNCTPSGASTTACLWSGKFTIGGGSIPDTTATFSVYFYVDTWPGDTTPSNFIDAWLNLPACRTGQFPTYYRYRTNPHSSHLTSACRDWNDVPLLLSGSSGLPTGEDPCDPGGTQETTCVTRIDGVFVTSN